MKAFTAVTCAVLLVGLAAPLHGEDQQKPQSPPTTAKPPQPAKPQPAKPKPVPLTPAQLAKRAPGRPGSFEVMGGAAWLGAGSIGSRAANLTVPASATPYRYFVTSGEIGSVPAVDARLTYNVSRRFSVEGGLNYSAPTLSVSIDNDTEGAVATTPAEKLTQYFVDASLLVFLPKMTFARGRGRVFVEGGAGYLRQLHEGNFSVETGQVYNAGAGVKQFFNPRPRGFLKGFGWRADVRAYYRDGGYSFEETGSWTVGVAGAAVVAF